MTSLGHDSLRSALMEGTVGAYQQGCGRSLEPNGGRNRHNPAAFRFRPLTRWRGMKRYIVFAMEGGDPAVVESTDVRRIGENARELRHVGIFESVAGRTLADLDREAAEGPAEAGHPLGKM